MFNSFADKLTAFIGSWKFVIIQTVVILCWMTINHPGNASAYDPYPWILLNLMMSTQAMYTGPVVMISQNRQEAVLAEQRERLEKMVAHIEDVVLRMETFEGRQAMQDELFNRKLDVLIEHLGIFPLPTHLNEVIAPGDDAASG